MSVRFPRVASLRDAAGLRARLEELGCPLPCDDEILSAPDSPLAREAACRWAGRTQRWSMLALAAEQEDLQAVFAMSLISSTRNRFFR